MIATIYTPGIGDGPDQNSIAVRLPDEPYVQVRQTLGGCPLTTTGTLHPMAPADPVAPPTPPTTGYENAPPPSVDDPTAKGFYCGARRSDQQIRQATEAGDTPWPWCRLRAGWGTDHSGAGSCKYHAGNTPNGRKAAQLKLEELRNPAIVALQAVLDDPNVSPQAKLRAVENVLDRTGHPRRLDVDMDAARENLVERIQAAMEAPEAEN